LVELAKQEHTEQCDDNVENYKVTVVGRGLRQKVIKLKKRNFSA